MPLIGTKKNNVWERQQRSWLIEQKVKLVGEPLFTNDFDTIRYDMLPAYRNADKLIKSLHRTFNFSRMMDHQSLTIIDEVVFNEPNLFEVALTSPGTWNPIIRNKNGGLFSYAFDFNELKLDTQQLDVLISSNREFTINPSETLTNVNYKYTRVGIRLKEKIKSAQIIVSFR